MKLKDKTNTELLTEKLIKLGWVLRFKYTRNMADLRRGSSTATICEGRVTYSNRF